MQLIVSGMIGFMVRALSRVKEALEQIREV